MQKRLYFILMLWVSCSLAFAQTSVQGVPRAHAKAARITRSATAIPVDFDQIQYWVGDADASCKAALVVKWNDGKGNNTNLVWGYRFTDESTGADMLRDIAAADPRFYMLVNGDTEFGITIGGLGYDLNGNGNIQLVAKGVSYDLVDGVYDCGTYSFDRFSSNDPDDRWQSGWTSGYWSYWTSAGVAEEYEYSPVGASTRILTDGCVDGWSYMGDMTNWDGGDMTGTVEYVSAPSATADYTRGTFFVNEDWYGHQNSTINFLSDEGEWVYRVVQKENPGIELGASSPHGQIYGGRFYVMSKQEKDPGASITGARLTVLDAKTMKVVKQFQTLGEHGGDGRFFLGVDEHKAYVGTSNGIRILDLDRLEFTGDVTGIASADGSAYDQLYSGQIGCMVRVNDRVFAVHQADGLLVINPSTDQVEQTIAGIDGWGYGSVVLSKDGNLWLSLAAKSGTGKADNRLLKLNPATLETEIITLPEGIYGPANSWYAWTPDCFSASRQQNVLYWNGGKASWFSGYTIFKYDIDKNEFSTYLDYTNAADGFYIYGCSFRIDPVSDEAYVSLYKGYGDPTYVVRKYDAEGNPTGEFPMIQNYWFPSTPVFPDNAAPVVNTPDEVTLSSTEAVKVSLKELATDADNFDAAIVKSVKAVSDEFVLRAEIQHGDLLITPLSNGSSTITIGINSNGRLEEVQLAVTIAVPTGIDNVPAEPGAPAIRYNMAGQRVNHQRGLQLIKTSDGTFKKVYVK